MMDLKTQNIIDKYLSHKGLVFFVLFLSIIISNTESCIAQKQATSFVTKNIILKNDTMAQFELPEVLVIPAYKFESKKQKRRYTKLVKHLVKVYPYARKANDALAKINHEIDSLGGDKRLIKKHIKQVDKQLQKQYGDELRKLTITQGRLLIKLIDRETGSTSYELVKELRGSFSAFMWQSLARLFGENLKEEYKPQEEDKMIEHIVLLIENNQL